VYSVLGVLALASVIAVGLYNAGFVPAPTPTPGLAGGPQGPIGSAPSNPPSASASPSAAPGPSIAPSPTPSPTPTPAPTPTLVRAPLTGVLVPPAVANRHPIAVMVDDLSPARPQSGFNAASIVWHAPAEGGIPRYMMIFADQIPTSVGPIRSARQYYIAWAAEWRAMYAHVGGSPQALATLRADGQGELVYDADQFRWGSRYMWRIAERFPPHNVYSDGKHLRQLARRIGATDEPHEPAWRFGLQTSRKFRPRGATIEVAYSANRITYRYDWRSNTYRRSVTGESRQIDAATGEPVAPRNVIVMLMRFGPLNDNPRKHRLEAQYVGEGMAWIATNGKTIKGTWKKTRIDRPTRFFDRHGQPVRLAPGQTFIQVLQTGSEVRIRHGKLPPMAHAGGWPS
jgi:Protein of unknown function (DUF3048) N-terminal domain/Protein of unknown function (DUF3048) C-terminal domain